MAKMVLTPSFPDDNFFEEVEASLVDMALAAGLTQDQLISRTLLSSDLDGMQGLIPVVAGSNVVFSGQIERDTFIAIYGVSYLGENITQLEITQGGSLALMWPLQAIGRSEDGYGYDTRPLYLGEGDSFNVVAFAQGAGDENISLQGSVVQRVGISRGF